MKMDSYDYYILGQEYLDRKEYLKAIKYFLISLKIKEHYKTYKNLYECYNCINCKELANCFIKLAYETHPKSDQVALIYVEVLKEEKELEKAKEICLEILKRNPTDKQAKIAYENLDKV